MICQIHPITSNILFFADDTTVTIKNNNFISLIINATNIMEKINVLPEANRLAINVNKTENMIYFIQRLGCN